MVACSHNLPPEGLGGSRSAGGRPAGVGSDPNPLLLDTGDKAGLLLGSGFESVTRGTVPSRGPWEQGRHAGLSSLFTPGRLRPRAGLTGGGGAPGSAAVGLVLGAQAPPSVWEPMDPTLVRALPPSSWMRPQQASSSCTRCAGGSGEPVSWPGWLPGGRRLPVVGAITRRQVLGLAGRGPGGHLPGAHAQT